MGHVLYQHRRSSDRNQIEMPYYNHKQVIYVKKPFFSCCFFLFASVDRLAAGHILLASRADNLVSKPCILNEPHLPAFFLLERCRIECALKHFSTDETGLVSCSTSFAQHWLLPLKADLKKKKYLNTLIKSNRLFQAILKISQLPLLN